MSAMPPHAERLLDKLQRALPLRARVRMDGVRPQPSRASPNSLLRCTVTQIYYADDLSGPMCRIAFDDDTIDSAPLLVPIARLKFERGAAITRDLAIYRRRRLQSLFEAHA